MHYYRQNQLVGNLKTRPDVTAKKQERPAGQGMVLTAKNAKEE